MMSTCWIIVGPNGAGKTTFAFFSCFVNDGESPVLAFEPRGDKHDIFKNAYYQRLLQEAER
jgi:ABC-type Mn2+/Zn2+ transport system ATPase subunit